MTSRRLDHRDYENDEVFIELESNLKRDLSQNFDKPPIPAPRSRRLPPEDLQGPSVPARKSSLPTRNPNHSLVHLKNTPMTRSFQEDSFTAPSPGYQITSCTMPLSHLVKTNAPLPRLVKIVQDKRICREKGDSLGGQIMLLKYHKKSRALQGSDLQSRPVTILQNSKVKLSPLKSEMYLSKSMSAERLLKLDPVPPVVRVANPFSTTKNGTVEAGTMLYLNSQTKKQVKAKIPNGPTFTITARSDGEFSANPDDVKVFPLEVICNISLPINVLLEHNATSEDIVTLKEVTEVPVMVAQPYDIALAATLPMEVELIADGSLDVVRIVLEEREKEEEVYYYAKCVAPVRQQPESNLEDYDDVGNWTQFQTSRPPSRPPSRTPSRTPSKEVPASPRYTQSPRRLPMPSKTDKDEEYIQMTHPISGLSPSFTSEDSKRQQNLALLKKQSVSDICNLLGAMKLEKYKFVFEREMIDGHLMASLTEEMLSKEFGIQSDVHKLRLMKIIDGTHSVNAFL